MTDDELKHYLQAMEERLAAGTRETVGAAEERLTERMRDMQTELLKAYLPTQEAGRVRDAMLESSNAAVVLRMGIMENRLAEIEKRLLLNPPAA